MFCQKTTKYCMLSSFKKFFEDLWNTDGPHLVPGTKRVNPKNPYNFEPNQGNQGGQPVPIGKKMKKMEKK